MGDEEGTPTKRRKKGTNANWRPVEVKQATVVTGGWMPPKITGFALHTSEFEFQGRKIEFVPLVLNVYWFLKVAGGR